FAEMNVATTCRLPGERVRRCSFLGPIVIKSMAVQVRGGCQAGSKQDHLSQKSPHDDFARRTEMGMAQSHGCFIWYELTTTDMDAARAFYTEVVGWGARDASMAGLPYTVFTAGEASVSGMMELPQVARQRGERPMWIGYVCVDDVDAVADRVKRLGGAV